jgi:5-oxoprolinase (ATP-hydrolysing) subunit A
MQLSLEEIYKLVAEQICLLQKIAGDAGTKLHHVKPHGALYNMAAKDETMANAIVKAVYDIDKELIFFGLSGSYLITEAEKSGLKTASEVFADRTYLADGSLTPRSQPNAMIETGEAAVQQVLQMIQEKTVTSINHKKIGIKAETICLHGDGTHALQFAKTIRQALQQNLILIKPISH